MSNSNFLHKENVSMLWDVISDEELFKFLSKTNQADVSQVFSSNIRGFFESEKVKNSNLVDINKFHAYQYLELQGYKFKCTDRSMFCLMRP